MIGTLTDKSCWTCKYLGDWTGGTFIQDLTCTWFPKHGRREEKKLWPRKGPDERCLSSGRRRLRIEGLDVFRRSKPWFFSRSEERMGRE
jgi:hypothetical protein